MARSGSVTAGAGRPGVLQRVRQRLLHDAVARELQPAGSATGSPSTRQRRVEPGLAGAAHELADAASVGGPSSGSESSRCTVPGEVAQLGERLAAGVRDEARRLAAASGSARARAARRPPARRSPRGCAPARRAARGRCAPARARSRGRGRRPAPPRRAPSPAPARRVSARCERSRRPPSQGRNDEEQRREDEVARLDDRHADDDHSRRRRRPTRRSRRSACAPTE